MDPQDFPRDLASVSPEWLSSVLGTEVVSFESTPLEQGVLSDLGIVKLTYAEGSTGPVSVVCKFAKGLDTSRGSAVGTDAYIKEIKFFETLGKEVPFRSPECLGLFRDAEKPNEFFCIVMEDSASPTCIPMPLTPSPRPALTAPAQTPALWLTQLFCGARAPQ